MAREDLLPAIKLFEGRVDEAERAFNEALGPLNVLRAEAGLPPRVFGGASQAAAAPATEIRSDMFFGKRQQTAIREYLEMRKAQGLGPAKPREIYDALLTGGFRYEAKDETTALVGLRALMRKRTNFFTKLPNGTYGLTAWYPELKRQKAAAAIDDDAEESVEDDVEQTKTASAGALD